MKRITYPFELKEGQLYLYAKDVQKDFMIDITLCIYRGGTPSSLDSDNYLLALDSIDGKHSFITTSQVINDQHLSLEDHIYSLEF
jgi:hypothetical protein